MKLKLKELKSNPFKKFINKGKLNKDRIQLLIESIEHGTLPEHFFVRKVENEYEITSGHHRIEAIRQKKGNNYEVDVTIVHYNDEQMLVDMVRENMTQRDTDFHDTLQSVVLARGWLQSGVQRVKQFDTLNIKKGLKGFQDVKDSCRSIATFLSKKGRAVSYESVRSYLKMNDDLHPDLLEKVKKVKGSAIENEEEGVIPVRDALAIAGIKNKEEQKTMANIVLNSDVDSGAERRKLITAYKELDDDTKKQILEGKVDVKNLQKVEQEPKTSGEMALTFNKRATELILEMRTLRKTLYQFRRERLFDNFTPRQRLSFKVRLNNVKKEYNQLIQELENSMEVL